jgi:hypothetical protein
MFGFSQGTAPIPFEGAPPPGRCAPCHTEIHEDWRASRHRVAWSNDLMIAGFVAEPLEFCVNCHAPLPEQRAEVLANLRFYRSLDPRRRTAAGIPKQHPEPTAGHGIHCATCHVRGDTYLAPERSDASPHDTRAVPEMATGDFCVNCHEFPMPVTHSGATVLSDAPMQSTGTEWRAWVASGGQERCQDCHMPGGRHVFRGAHDQEWLKQSVSVELSAARDRFTLRSVGVGHDFPTGDLFRHLTLEVDRGSGFEVVDWMGRQFERDPEDVRRVSSNTSLKPGEPRIVEVSGAFARWRLVYHYGSAADEARGLLDPDTIRVTLAMGR